MWRWIKNIYAAGRKIKIKNKDIERFFRKDKNNFKLFTFLANFMLNLNNKKTPILTIFYGSQCTIINFIFLISRVFHRAENLYFFITQYVFQI